MHRVQWIVGAVVALALSGVSILLGLSFLPSRVEALERGSIMPWVIAWALIGIAALSGVAIAGFLFSTLRGETGRAS
jgi:hypothetical protein